MNLRVPLQKGGSPCSGAKLSAGPIEIRLK
jgi:hypothetical protein